MKRDTGKKKCNSFVLLMILMNVKLIYVLISQVTIVSKIK